MSEEAFAALFYLFIVYEAVTFLGVTALLLVEKRSVPADVEIGDETTTERAKVLGFLAVFAAGLVGVFFAGS